MGLETAHFNRKPALQTGGVKFERCGRLPDREHLMIDGDALWDSVFLELYSAQLHIQLCF